MVVSEATQTLDVYDITLSVARVTERKSFKFQLSSGFNTEWSCIRKGAFLLFKAGTALGGGSQGIVRCNVNFRALVRRME